MNEDHHFETFDLLGPRLPPWIDQLWKPAQEAAILGVPVETYLGNAKIFLRFHPAADEPGMHMGLIAEQARIGIQMKHASNKPPYIGFMTSGGMTWVRLDHQKPVWLFADDFLGVADWKIVKNPNKQGFGAEAIYFAEEAPFPAESD